MDYNVLNGGLVLKVDDGFIISDLKGCFTSYRSVTDGMFWFMSTDGEYVFYSDQKRKNYLCRMWIKNSICEVILEKPCYNLVLYEDWLYFINENDRKIYSCMKDGRKEIKVVDDNVINFTIENGRIYYTTPHGIRSCSDTGSQKENISAAVGTSLIMLGNKLAYIDKNESYSIAVLDLDTNTASKIEGIQTQSLNTDGRYLYCINRANAKNIYRVDPVSCTSIRIYADSSEYLHIIENMVYFYTNSEWFKMALTGGQAINI